MSPSRRVCTWHGAVWRHGNKQVSALPDKLSPGQRIHGSTHAACLPSPAAAAPPRPPPTTSPCCEQLQNARNDAADDDWLQRHACETRCRWWSRPVKGERAECGADDAATHAAHAAAARRWCLALLVLLVCSCVVQLCNLSISAPATCSPSDVQ